MNKFCIIITILLTLIVNISCNRTPSVRITDRAGRQVTLPDSVNRIVSTAPSNTEIIVDLGMAHKLIAIDRHSANVSGIPDGLPLLDFFFPDAEFILGLQPDIIIASGHNPTGAGDDPFRLLSEAGISVVYIPMSRSIEDIYRDIAFIAEILRVQENGEEVIRSMQAEIAEISFNAVLRSRHYTVYFEISPPPEMMTFGRDSFIDDMLRLIRVTNIFGDENWLVTPGAEAVIIRNPDVIFTNVNFIDDPIGEIKRRPGFNHINAVINNRIYQIDNDSSVRPSPRITFALRQMIHALHPELYEQP